jgi:hypothetical protein
LLGSFGILCDDVDLVGRNPGKSDSAYLVAKICNKYKKHLKSYVGFQLSGQTGPIWAVLKISAILLAHPTFPLDVCEKEELPCLLYLMQIFA